MVKRASNLAPKNDGTNHLLRCNLDKANEPTILGLKCNTIDSELVGDGKMAGTKTRYTFLLLFTHFIRYTFSQRHTHKRVHREENVTIRRINEQRALQK